MSSPMQAMKPNEGSCNCGWDDCIGLCCFLEPFDEDVLETRPRAFEAMDAFDFDVALQKDNDSVNKNTQKEGKLVDYGATEKAQMMVAANYQNEDPGYARAPESLQEPPAERKRIKEKNRREDINKGLQELTSLIFVIDPDLKERAKKKSTGMIPCADESKLLGRVELVNSAVTTLARVYQDNEVHKMILSHLTGCNAEEEKSGGDGMPLFPFLPNVSEALSLDEAEDTSGKNSKLSRLEIKKNREKKRRADMSKGLEMLSRMILIIDPQLKAAAVERAKTLHASGTMSNIKESQLLSRTELVNVAVSTLARIHKENEVHKMLIARLATARRDESSPQSSGPRNVISPSLNDDISAEDTRQAQPMPSLPGANLLGNDAGTSQGDESTEALQEQVTFDSLDQAPFQGETLSEVSFHEDEPAAKRLKTCHEGQD